MSERSGSYRHVVLFKFHAHTGPEGEAVIVDAFAACAKNLSL
jgi:hypothetical protein